MPYRRNHAVVMLIKENHLRFCGSVEGAVEAARKKYKKMKIEIEAENMKQASEAANAGADIILLDNFTPARAKEAVKMIKKINRRIVIELSGGISLKNLKQYVNLGAGRISMGQLTKEAKIIDFSLDIRKV